MSPAGRRRPIYAQMLGLRRLRPGPVLCFIYLEGSVALAILLTMAGLVSWWTILVLPLAVAAMVKLNDMVAVAAASRRSASPARRERPEEPVQETAQPAAPDPAVEPDEADKADEGGEMPVISVSTPAERSGAAAEAKPEVAAAEAEADQVTPAAGDADGDLEVGSAARGSRLS